MKWITYNIAILVIAFTCDVIALPTVRRLETVPGKALIDCEDLLMIKLMKKAGIPYICLQEQLDENDTSSLKDSSANSVIPYDDGADKAEAVALAEEEINRLFSESAQQSKTSEDSNDPIPTKCPTGLVQHDGECVSVNLLNSEYTNPESIVEDSESTDGTCKDGKVFNVEKGKCVTKKNVLSIIVDDKDGSLPYNGQGQSLPVVETDEVVSVNKDGEATGSETDEIVPINKNEEIIRKVKCNKGFIFVPSTNLCLPVTPGAHSQQPKVESVEVAIVRPPGGCPKGSVYSPEIDHCLFTHINPMQEKTIEEIEELFIKNTKPSSVIVEEEVIGKAKCKKGTVYSPEIDHCLPVNLGHREIRDISIQETDISEKNNAEGSSGKIRLKLEPLTASEIGENKCGTGEVYVSEIDLCLTP